MRNWIIVSTTVLSLVVAAIILVDGFVQLTRSTPLDCTCTYFYLINDLYNFYRTTSLYSLQVQVLLASTLAHNSGRDQQYVCNLREFGPDVNILSSLQYLPADGAV